MPITMIPATVSGSMVMPSCVLTLKAEGEELYLLIQMESHQGQSILLANQSANIPRPMSHDLACTFLRELGMTVSEVLIADFQGETFYARLVGEKDGRHIEIDARPSDAIPIAMRLRVPIRVNETVLEARGVRPAQAPPAASTPVEHIDPSRLGVFRGVIDGLNLDNLGGGKPTAHS